MKDITIQLVVVLILVQTCFSHVTLVFPPSRKPSYDFLDNVRTGGPCGVPYPGDDEAIFTTFATGSTINVTFHLAYPHRGGILINILENNGSVLHKLFDDWDKHDDTTTTNIQITLPENFTCDRCILQLLRQAGEWIATGGYVFWTCSDISIQDNDFCNNGTCSGNGVCTNGQCTCDNLYSGDFCQFKDDCIDESDCNDHGSCLAVSTVKYPSNQCFCNQGWFGKQCETVSSITEITFNQSLYTIQRKFLNRLDVYSRLVNDDTEIEFVLSVNATGYVAIGFRPPNMNAAACRNNAPGAYDVGTNPGWPNGQLLNILGISGEFTIDGSAAEEETEEEETQEEETQEEETQVEETQEEETQEETTQEEEEEEEPDDGSMHGMDCVDLVIGTARGNQYRILDYYTRDRSTPMLDNEYGGTQDLTGAIGQEVDGVTTIIFRRKMQSDDVAGDHSITDALYHVIWSFGQVWPDYTHTPGSGIEAGTAGNDRFYQPDEIKYHGSSNRGMTTINFFRADQERNPNCDGVYDNGDYFASWSVKGLYIQFNVSARVTINQWVAIGFSDDMFMTNSDVVIGASDGTQSFIQDRTIGSSRAMPTMDTFSNIMSTSVSRDNGFTNMSFIRLLDTLDTEDISLTQDRFFIFGWGGPFDYQTGNVGQHVQTPIVSPSRIVIPNQCIGTFEEGSGAGTVSITLSLIILTVLSLIMMS